MRRLNVGRGCERYWLTPFRDHIGCRHVNGMRLWNHNNIYVTDWWFKGFVLHKELSVLQEVTELVVVSRESMAGIQLCHPGVLLITIAMLTAGKVGPTSTIIHAKSYYSNGRVMGTCMDGWFGVFEDLPELELFVIEWTEPALLSDQVDLTKVNVELELLIGTATAQPYVVATRIGVMDYFLHGNCSLNSWVRLRSFKETVFLQLIVPPAEVTAFVLRLNLPTE